jgi:hypothetical protein
MRESKAKGGVSKAIWFQSDLYSRILAYCDTHPDCNFSNAVQILARLGLDVKEPGAVLRLKEKN